MARSAEWAETGCIVTTGGHRSPSPEFRLPGKWPMGPIATYFDLRTRARHEAGAGRAVSVPAGVRGCRRSRARIAQFAAAQGSDGPRTMRQPLEFPVSNPPHGVIRNAEHLALGTSSEARGARCDALGTWILALSTQSEGPRARDSGRSARDVALRVKGAGEEAQVYRGSGGWSRP